MDSRSTNTPDRHNAGVHGRECALMVMSDRELMIVMAGLLFLVIACACGARAFPSIPQPVSVKETK